ncbi:GLE1-like protein-domain-containing protein [Apodospora peruviana]|uniref:mRNA export factor GLE1 n=1 Tax=Apodospora peruviana TaxID=516989 RepID=A0AAE0MBY5_9PEZI|nr:GLE1-like protein-domain-containing protein [Apodospora peruviana]
MTGSSPARPRSLHWASPQRPLHPDIFGEDRNSEARHKFLIESAKREHDRVREDAERVYRDHLQKEEQQRLLQEKRKEEERIRRDEQIAAEVTRVNALKAKQVVIPAPLPDPEPPRPPAVIASAPPAVTSSSAAPPATPAPQPPSQVNVVATQNGVTPKGPSFSPDDSRPLLTTPQQLLKRPEPPLLQSNGTAPAPKAVAPPVAQNPAIPAIDRYTTIHRNLKELRRSMAQQANANRALKSRIGDMRREIRKSVGQLTAGTGANRVQQQKIVALLREALQNQVQSQLIDPSNFVMEPRNPVEGAVHNEPQLPSLFLYLLNIFAKAAIAQFINEAGARPETADPVGICIAATFSEPDFLWHGVSLIDILIAKFRIVCPVLFGYKGSEKTEQGRQRLGWWKDSGSWVTEQQHMDRMTGLGAGFAAVSLRNFGPSKKTNPYPPRHYWTAMAKIVNTPSADISNTQCVVLKSMIQNYEQKFIQFYGTAAIAALRTSLLEFPGRAPQKSAAVNSLGVLAELLKKDSGLVLG